MKRKPRLRYVKFQFTKGKLYAYFNTGQKANGKPLWTALPPYNSPGFFDSYNAMMGHRTRRVVTAVTIKDLVARYEASNEFGDLKPNSRKLYRLTLDKVLAEFGAFPLEDVTRQRIMAVLNDVLTGNATRNIFLSVLAVLFRFARRCDLTAADPTKDIPRYKTGEHEPWPRELLDVALTCDDQRVRLAVHLLYFTGQRIGDVCAMRWGNIRGNRIALVQEKTAKVMSIALHRDLAAELERTAKAGMTIIAGQNGLPIGTNTLRKNIQEYAAGIGYSVVPHGLRKNAVNSLLEAGCLPQQVAAVTGQSMQMVEHYAKRINQPMMADSAILKLEQSKK